MTDFDDLIASTREVHFPDLSASAVRAVVAPGSAHLEFELWHQLMTMWCWAAVSSAIGNYYAGTELWTQCSVASLVRGKKCCPTNPVCNKGNSLKLALMDVGHLNRMFARPLSVADIQAQIDRRHPVGVRIARYNNGGHFIVIDGYSVSNDGELISVEDPWTGSHDVVYHELVTAYAGKGSWSHAYVTSA